MASRTVEITITGNADPLIRELRRAELEMQRARMVRGRRLAVRAAFNLGRAYQRAARQEHLENLKWA